MEEAEGGVTKGMQRPFFSTAPADHPCSSEDGSASHTLLLLPNIFRSFPRGTTAAVAYGNTRDFVLSRTFYTWKEGPDDPVANDQGSFIKCFFIVTSWLLGMEEMDLVAAFINAESSYSDFFSEVSMAMPTYVHLWSYCVDLLVFLAPREDRCCLLFRVRRQAGTHSNHSCLSRSMNTASNTASCRGLASKLQTTPASFLRFLIIPIHSSAKQDAEQTRTVGAMACVPPPLWAAYITAQERNEKAPTQEEYLTLLRHECRRRGLIDWNNELTETDILRAFPFESYMNARPLRHTDLTKEQWADPTDPINNFECEEANDPFSDGVDWDQKALEQSKQREDWNEMRKTMLVYYAPRYLQPITANAKLDFLATGGTQQRLDDIEATHPDHTILHWLAELWNLQQQQIGAKDPHKDRTLSVMVFSDIPQEDVRVVYCKIPYAETWPGFTATMAAHFFIRHLVKKHHPRIAPRLFPVDDDTIWPPEGVLPFRDEDDNVVDPEQDHPRRADLVYDNGPGRGWWSSVIPKASATGLLGVHTEWRALDGAEDWDGLMAWLDGYREATAAFRHLSTKERAEFVEGQRQREEAVLGFPGYRTFNVHLERHRRKVQDQRLLYGPLREELAVEEGREEERLMIHVPEGSERLRSRAARENDEILRRAGIQKVVVDESDEDEGMNVGVDLDGSGGRGNGGVTGQDPARPMAGVTGATFVVQGAGWASDDVGACPIPDNSNGHDDNENQSKSLSREFSETRGDEEENAERSGQTASPATVLAKVVGEALKALKDR